MRTLRHCLSSLHTLVFLTVAAAVSVHAASRTWTGAADTQWAVARNWLGSVKPAKGDALIFPVGAVRKETWNSLVTPFDSLEFGGSYSVAGAPVTTARLRFEGNVTGFERDTLLLDASVILTNAGAVEVYAGRLTFLRDVTLPTNGATLSVTRWDETAEATLRPRGWDSALSFQWPIQGDGGVRKVGDGAVFFTTNNTYTGGTVIEGGSLHLVYGDPIVLPEPTLVTPFGTRSPKVEVRSGASLVLSRPMQLDDSVSLNGSGVHGLGALIVNDLLPAARHQIRALSLGSGARIGSERSGTRLGVSLVSSPVNPPPLLALHGGVLMSLVGPQARLKVPLLVTEGTFAAVDAGFEGARIHEASWPRVEQALTVGAAADATTRLAALVDLRLPESLATNSLTPVSAIADNVPINVTYGGEVMFGPRQVGLGSPLSLRAGAVLLVPSKELSNAVAGFHSGTVRVETARFDASSFIFGPLGIRDTLTLISTSSPLPELTFGALDRTLNRGWIEGDTLVADGVHLKLRGPQSNRLARLVVRRGSLSLGQGGGAGAAVVTTIGQDNRFAPLVNLTAGSNQFPEDAVLEIKPSGNFTIPATLPPFNHVAQLRMTGGQLSPMNLSCDTLEVREGTRVSFVATDGKTNLTVRKDWIWQGSVVGYLDIRRLPPGGPEVRLVDFQGTQPIPGRFLGLPDGGTVTNQAVVYRISYSGGDGNDLVIEPVFPAGRPKLTLSKSAEGWPTLSWPEAGGCRIEYQPVLDPALPWIPVVVTPPVGGVFSHIITPSDNAGGGFYRLNCP